MRKGITLLSLFFLIFKVSSQTPYDSFTDGDFTISPVWGGGTSNWTIAANSDVAAGAVGSNTVRLNATAISATEYMSSQILNWYSGQEWGVWIGRRAQGYTATNQSFFWLYATESDLTSLTVDGYRIAIGDNTGNDEIRLEYIVNGAVSSTVITSSGAITNGLLDIGVLLRVTRTASGLWTLYSSTLPTVNGGGSIATDIPNAANTPVNQGTGNNNSLILSSNGYIGLAAQHTTGASSIIAAEFDQFYFSEYLLNTITTGSVSTPPFILSDCSATTSGSVDFTSADVFNSGNEYHVQLSDDIGSFATPIDISSPALVSTANSGTISFQIPAGTPSGAGYKIRVVSTNPSVNGNSSSAFSITQAGYCSSSHTDYYRSRASGNWENPAVWESSPDGIVWISPATLAPTYNANTITIRNGNTITITTAASADQFNIEAGGVLVHTSGAGFALNDNASGTDMTVNGTYVLNGNQPIGGGTIEILSGGIVRVDANPSPGESDDFAFGNASVIFRTGSVYEWNASGYTPQWSGRTYFTPAENVVLRFSVSPNFGLGGGSATVINGTLDVNAPIILQGASSKTFRNGVTGIASVYSDATFTSNIIINGSAAVLGGPGNLILPASPYGLQIGSGTEVTLLSAKAIKGDITLLANSFINLGIYNLTDTGSITGGSATSYIKTNSTGALILGNVAGTRFAPVGNITYNPLTITNTSGHNWSVRVEDALGVTNPVFAGSIPKAVQREWHITPSVNPPLTGADIVLEYDDNPLATPRQTGASFITTENVQTWHEIFYVPTGTYEWLAAGNAQPPSGAPGGTRTVSIFNWSWFSPFAISNISAPLPIKLTRFDAVKLSASHALVSWELAACCSKGAKFELEKSTDGSNYTLLATLAGSDTGRHYSYADNRLAAGVTHYRLKVTEADGRITYSRIATVTNTEGNDGLSVSLFPNPVSEQTLLLVSAAKKETVQLSIISSSGVVVKQWQQEVAAGIQTTAADLRGLPAGIYQLVCRGETQRAVLRFVKQ